VWDVDKPSCSWQAPGVVGDLPSDSDDDYDTDATTVTITSSVEPDLPNGSLDEADIAAAEALDRAAVRRLRDDEEDDEEPPRKRRRQG
jgi:hypothetical protein